MKPLAIFLSILVLSSCALTKQERRMNRATKKLERLVKKYPELARTDTIEMVRTIVTPRVQIDTVHAFSSDTVEVVKENLRIRYVTDTITNTIWLDAICDTIVITDTVRVAFDRVAPVRYETPERMKRKMANRFWIGVVVGIFGMVLIWIGVGRLRG